MLIYRVDESFLYVAQALKAARRKRGLSQRQLIEDGLRKTITAHLKTLPLWKI